MVLQISPPAIRKQLNVLIDTPKSMISSAALPLHFVCGVSLTHWALFIWLRYWTQLISFLEALHLFLHCHTSVTVSQCPQRKEALKQCDVT